MITGTFTHLNGHVLRVWIEGQAQPLEPTEQHLFWSESGRAWVKAGELRAGEVLRTVEGKRLAVASVEALPGVHRVYNLEVEQEHHYYAGQAGVLVHNAYASTSGNNVSSVRGRSAHQRYSRYMNAQGYSVNRSIPGGGRPDAWKVLRDAQGRPTRVLLSELKPSRARSVARGLRQLDKYEEELRRAYPELAEVPFTKFLETY